MTMRGQQWVNCNRAMAFGGMWAEATQGIGTTYIGCKGTSSGQLFFTIYLILNFEKTKLKVQMYLEHVL